MSYKSCKELRARPRQQILSSLYTTTLATSTRKLVHSLQVNRKLASCNTLARGKSFDFKLLFCATGGLRPQPRSAKHHSLSESSSAVAPSPLRKRGRADWHIAATETFELRAADAQSC